MASNLGIHLKTMRAPRLKATPSHYCAICEKITKAGKPYCVDHVTRTDYARWIHSELERKATEITRLDLKKPKLDDSSFLVREALALLFATPSTAAAFARSQDLNVPQCEKLFRELRRMGYVKLHTNSRGSLVAELKVLVPPE